MKQFDEVLKYVNELSNTIDLTNTRVRAEALFRRFQRTVEAMDRKRAGKHLPSPVKRRSTSSVPAVDNTAAASSSSGSNVANGKKKEEEGSEGLDISEDLRKLLSREVIRATTS